MLLNQGKGAFAPAVDYAVGLYARSIVATDLDGDGKPDLAVANGASVSVLLNQGKGAFAPAVDYLGCGGPMSVVAADLNDDGRPDLAVADYLSDQVCVLLTSCLP
ncbi:MAG: VCBS repeat-containing protein [Minicystis sp.]